MPGLDRIPTQSDRSVMNYEATLHKKETENVYGTVVVDKVEYKDIGDGYWVKLEGTDPKCYPLFVQDKDLTWFSKNLTLMLHEDDPIDLIAVSTTDKPIPEPDVRH